MEVSGFIVLDLLLLLCCIVMSLSSFGKVVQVQEMSSKLESKAK